jgi:hypothetical protein
VPRARLFSVARRHGGDGSDLGALGVKLDDGFARLDSRIDALTHRLAYVGAGLVAASLSFLAVLLGLIVTQL